MLIVHGHCSWSFSRYTLYTYWKFRSNVRGLLAIKYYTILETNFDFFFAVFFRNKFKVHWFRNFKWLHRKNHFSFYFQKYIMLIKNSFFLVKKLEIQVNVFMIMFSRSLERIFNPMRYTGYEWPKRMNFILSIIYGSTRRHSNSSKSF